MFVSLSNGYIAIDSIEFVLADKHEKHCMFVQLTSGRQMTVDNGKDACKLMEALDSYSVRD